MKTDEVQSIAQGIQPIAINNSLQILRIVVFSPLRKHFDYLPPPHIPESGLKPGMRVKVPFGTKERIGILVEVASSSPLALEKLKPALEILDPEPLFSEAVLKLIFRAAHYYHCPLGEVFEAAIPTALRKITQTKEPKPKKTKKNHEDVVTQEATLTQNTMLASFTEAEHEKSLRNPIVLNADQTASIQAINQAQAQSTFSPFVLEGVTGSGKTEVYLQVIAYALEQGKQALILVPEIGLIPQMLERLQARFTHTIAVLHSGLTEKQRLNAWQAARLGEAQIILGTRSAVFTPLKNAGIFIIDEEHDLSFKQQDSFRYSARDLMVMRATLEHCPVLLGTATLSLETLLNTEKKGFKLLKLHHRTNEQPPPRMHIMDIRHKQLDQGLSYPLIKKIKEHLAQQGQVLIFLNRRGFSPVYMCYDCGEMLQCKHCDAYLTLHFQKKQLKCHHCDYQIPQPDTCKACGSKQLNPVGVGTERLESALAQHFPDHNILRIDKDTTRKKGAMQAAVDRIHSGDAHILLGTQMLTKGHHFPNLTLVAIIDIDSALFSVDFRSTERLGQLITQVGGRAGRANRLGEVILQTCHPNHPILQLLLKEGYAAFAQHLLSERNLAKLPPFTHSALIRTQAKHEKSAFHFLNTLKHFSLKIIKDNTQVSNLHVLGPIAASMERKQGKYQAHLLLQANTRSSLHYVLSGLIEYIENANLARGVQFSLDIDPQEI